MPSAMDVTFELDTTDLALRYRNMSQTQYKAGLFLLKLMDIPSGANAVDVGAGTGEHVVKIAEIVGDTGTVTGVEPLAARVKLADESYGSTRNITFTVGNAEDLSHIESASKDAVFSNASYHWFNQPERALAEFCRVLKPGGYLGISTGCGDQPYIQDVIKEQILAQARFENYPESKKGVAKYPKRNDMVEALKKAGFAMKIVAEHYDERPFNTAEDAMKFVQTSSFGNFLGHLPDYLKADAEAEMVAEFGKYRRADKICFDIVRLVVVAVKI